MPYTLTFSTPLRVSPAEAWTWITSFDGISKEMAPYMRMTKPRGVTSLASVDYQPGKRLFRSWVLLFGVIPFDYSDLTLLTLDEGVGFVEQSPMCSMRLWRHERHITPNETRSTLTDTLTFEPRLFGWLTYNIVRAFFTRRHRMLARHLGDK